MALQECGEVGTIVDILGNTELTFEMEAPGSSISNFTSKLKFFSFLGSRSVSGFMFLDMKI